MPPNAIERELTLQRAMQACLQKTLVPLLLGPWKPLAAEERRARLEQSLRRLKHAGEVYRCLGLTERIC